MAAHFRPDVARDLQAVIDWKIWDRPGGGYDHYQLLIHEGSCEIRAEPTLQPDVELKMKPADFLKLASSNASPTKLAMRRRLHVVGDIRLARRIPDMFDIPSA
jgi:putative sterol carrier protein